MIKGWQMMSGDDHCNEELADEVRRGRGGEGGGRGDLDRSRASDIKSDNPHLAGGEKHDKDIGKKGGSTADIFFSNTSGESTDLGRCNHCSVGFGSWKVTIEIGKSPLNIVEVKDGTK